MITRAEELLLKLPVNRWISFKTLPFDLHIGIIEISDSFIWKQRKIEFNDDETAIRILQA